MRVQELEYPDVPSTDYNTRAPPANAEEVNERSLPADSRAEAEAHCTMLEVHDGFAFLPPPPPLCCCAAAAVFYLGCC